MATEIVMPKMGYDMTEGKLLRWLKQEGDAVKKGEPIAEIETDKVSIEVEAFDAGVLRRILVQEGETVAVGARIGIIAAPGEALPDEAPAGTPPSPTLHAPSSAPAMVPAYPGAEQPAGQHVAPVAARGARSEASINASPLARRLAHEHGVDLATLQGTGPGGRITREDVLAAAEAPAPAQESAAESPSSPRQVGAASVSEASATLPADAPAASTLPEGGSAAAAAGELRLTRLQQTMGRHMVESKTQAPHFYVTMRVDMTEAMAFRRQLNEREGATVKISVNDLIVKATARALTAFPRLNASFAGDRLILHDEVAICVAVALEDGLVTPVVRQTARKPLEQIARETASLVARTRSGKNRPEDYEGGTFTVSNLGMFDVETFIAIINPPQAAILAVGAVQRLPVFKGEALMPRLLMSLTLSADHRVTDGATAARFLTAIRQDLESPAGLLE
ncbi:MAG TPA: dihydrolipoamide acetyltransferase family protein [Chloroflexota bacterium]|nr:dihydrolipoamide acetyltransferase family protein [Chloroflexota bacterium]